jgi:hypothetical protein
LDGSVVAGRLEAMGPDGIRWSDGSATATLKPEDLREIRVEPPAARAAPRVPHLRLTLVTGDRILGTFAAPSKDGISVEHASAGPLTVPFEAIRSVEAMPAGGDPCLDEAAKHPPAEGSDRVHLRSGDAYSGVVVEAAAEGIRIETERGAERLVPWNALSVVHLQTEQGAASPEPAGAGIAAEVETDDGSRFVTAAYPTGDAAAIAFALRAAPEIRVKVPWPVVRRVRTRSDRFAYASELAWTGTYFDYYEPAGDGGLNRVWFAPRADRRPANSGCPLRIGDREYARGFGVHSRTVITVPLGGAWKAFETGIGIDDDVRRDPAEPETGEPRGDVDVRILGDDRVLWEAKGVKGGEPLRRAGPLDVSGVKTLVLEVDWGGGALAPAHDHADWVDPILVR